MNPSVSPEIKEVIGAVHYRPAVSIIMPFEPKMSAKTEITQLLKFASDKVERELVENYPQDICTLIMQKLNALIKHLNFTTHKKSIAIFVSPVFEKVLYLDITVEEKIIIDESFEIRDLVYCKKQSHKYLVLLLSGKEAKMFIGNSTEFMRIISDTPETVDAYVNEVPERVANFSDVQSRREIVMNKFLQHIDNSLDVILNAYHLPLFILGADRIAGHFKAITKHNAAVIEYIHGNYEEASEDKLKKLLEPYIADWNKVHQKNLLNKLEDAASKHKLAKGMKEVWKEAMQLKGKLLLVEKNYMFAAEHGMDELQIYKAVKPYNNFSYIKDAVDDVIEKVLENGGDVEFVDEDLLKDYEHIALLQYY